jgi:hypothetical protein
MSSTNRYDVIATKRDDRPDAGDRSGSGQSVLLYQSRPNPTVGTAKIAYWQGCEMEIDLRLYDIRGRLVATLQRGMQPAGFHQT